MRSAVNSKVKKVASIGKKVFIAAALYTIVIAAFIAFANPKQFAINSSNYQTITTKPLYEMVRSPANNKTKKQKAVNDLTSLIACQTVGELCSPTQQPGSDEYFKKSALGNVANYISISYTNPPASGMYWARAQFERIGLAPKTYAAEGIGLAGLKPFASLWILFRNAAYLLLTLLIVAIGLMIMFRLKVNPQTVITLENSLPRIVITILLITFSFPIAGFMIDLMYALIFLAISIFAAVDPAHFTAGMLNTKYATASFATLWEGFFPSLDPGRSGLNPLGELVGLADLGSALLDVLPSVINDTIRVVGSAGIVWALYKFGLSNGGVLEPFTRSLNGIEIFGNRLGDLLGSYLYYAILILIVAVTVPFTLTFGGGWILAFIIWFTLLALFFRVMVMLFASYLRIILFTIFSPFIILSTAVPGRNGFTYWLRALAGELSVFPTVIILLLVGRLIVMAFTLNNNTIANPGNFFDPGTTESVWTPPFLWGINQRALAIIVGMQIIFLIPSIARLVRGKISGSKGLPFDTGASVFFGGVAGGAALGMGGLGRFQTLAYGANYIPGLGKTGVGKWLQSKTPGHPPHAAGGGGGAHKAPESATFS